MDERHIQDCLKLFDLPDLFSEEQLKQAYRDLVQIWHPDRHSQNPRLRAKADEKMKQINEAYRELQSCLVNGRFQFHGIQETAHAPAHPEPTTDSPSSARSGPAVESPQPGAFATQPYVFWSLLALLAVVLLAGVKAARHHAKSPQRPVAEAASEPAANSLSSLEEMEVLPVSPTPPLPFCNALDEKNGFKDLKFGMSPSQVTRQARPQVVLTNEYTGQVIFLYRNGALNQLGGIPLDLVQLSFFRGALFKVSLSFFKNQDQIFEALRQSYGPPRQGDGWTRAFTRQQANYWAGSNVVCALVASKTGGEPQSWDGAVLYAVAKQQAAQQYAEAEPMRAMQSLSDAGFGRLGLGMSLKKFQELFTSPPAAEEVGLQRTAFEILSGDDLRLARYPLQKVRVEFFKNRLFKIELFFEANQDKIFKGFMAQFPDAAETAGWARGTQELLARQHLGSGAVTALVAPKAASPIWDEIYLCDQRLDRERAEFESKTPTRAGKDL